MQKYLPVFFLLLLLVIPDPAGARHYRDSRPYAWCGWYMRTLFGGGPEFNLARNWAHFGRRASGPAKGVIVVWRHHVGEIVGRGRHGLWMVHSGNDGHAVRTRPRSLSGAIAFRWPDTLRRDRLAMQ